MNALRTAFPVILLALSAPGLRAGTLTLGVATGYNVFVLGAYATPGNTDIQGSVAVGGGFTATGNLSINEVPGSATPSSVGLVVGGSLSLAGGQLDNTNAGNAIVGGSVSSSSYFNFEQNLTYGGTLSSSNIVVGGTTTHASAVPINFTTAATSLDQLSGNLNSLTANGTVVLNGSTYTLTATGCTVCVFDFINGGNPNNAVTFTNSEIDINAPTGATVVVNVDGVSDSFTNSSIKYTGGATASNTLFNFDLATSLNTTGITIYGSILAPLATFTGMNGSVDGELIAGAVSGETAEFESGDIFSGNLGTFTSATPEPSAWVLMGIGLLGCVGMRARRGAVAGK